jgi:hypothetical protein
LANQNPYSPCAGFAKCSTELTLLTELVEVQSPARA